jgi:tripeptidyl-peptidase I
MGQSKLTVIRPDLDTVSGLYNRIGRAYPDVSANGANLRAYTNGIDYHWYGTSLASPLFASVLTLVSNSHIPRYTRTVVRLVCIADPQKLNQERAKVGKGPIGFVNPVLYAHPEVLHDIKNGTSAGCGTDGFAAVEGWDPATGLGTPNYPKMLELWLALP